MNNFDVVGNVSTTAAAHELALANAPHWDAFTTRQRFPGSPHSDTKCIPLRGASAFLESYKPLVARKATVFSAYLPHTVALVNKVLNGLPVLTVGNVLAVALMPGGQITPHIDEGDYPTHFERFHIVVTSPTGNWFKCGEEVFMPNPGDIFFFNHRLTHSVGNPSSEARIHLIVDVTLKE